jgi:hypothetical protein
MGESASAALDYAIDGQSVRRRRVAVRLITLALLLGTAIAGFHFREPISPHFRRWYWARQCLTQVTPPRTVLVERDPLKARSLVDSNPDYVMTPYTRPFPSNFQAMRSSRQTVPPTAEYAPRELHEFFKVTAPPGQAQQSLHDEAVVFLGARNTPAGQQRLVVIYGSERNAVQLDSNPFIQTEVYIPQPLFGRVPQPKQVAQQTMASSGRYIPAVLSPGVADPADPTHLTIDFRIESFHVSAQESEGILDVS